MYSSRDSRARCLRRLRGGTTRRPRAGTRRFFGVILEWSPNKRVLAWCCARVPNKRLKLAGRNRSRGRATARDHEPDRPASLLHDCPHAPAWPCLVGSQRWGPTDLTVSHGESEGPNRRPACLRRFRVAQCCNCLLGPALGPRCCGLLVSECDVGRRSGLRRLWWDVLGGGFALEYGAYC